jgi:transforming growth factor-beta-induced protein
MVKRKSLIGVLLGFTGMLIVPAVAYAAGCGSSMAGSHDHSGSVAVAADSGKKSGCAWSKGEKNIVQTAMAAGKFNTLAAALKATDMVETLQGKGPFTVFAPTDEAFAKLPAGTLESLLNDEPKLRAILKYHVVPGNVMAADVVKLDSAKTALGQSVDIKTMSNTVKVDNARVISTDIKASNGVIHVIDSVILPDDSIVDVAVEAGQFKTLLTAVEAAGLTDTLRAGGPYTVFAPTDEAFAKLPEGTIPALLNDKPKLRAILKYHVVPAKVTAKEVVELDSAETLLGQTVEIRHSSPVRINGALITKTDIMAANGVIHVIDEVILPPADIVDVAREAGSFNTLLKAVHAAGLADTLRSKGPFTVFAPTDAAFAKLPEGTISKLLDNPDKLASILKYHVVPGKVMAADVVKLSSAKTVLGQSVDIDTSGGVKVDGANVVKTDIETSNGVIHVIDSVILPD